MLNGVLDDAALTDAAIAVLLLAVGTAAHLWLRGLETVTPVRGRRTGPVSVSVVVPARNEEGPLASLLASLLSSRHGRASGVDVVVVDDGSIDRTVAVARAGGARVVTAGAPPPGWTGKAWACQAGVRASTGEHLLFLDADTVLAPDAVEALLEVHDRHGGLVSVQPFHEVVEPYEQFSSYFNVVSLFSSAAAGHGPARAPMAFGPCLLTSRADYELAGGHAAVRGDILDDVRLAAAYHRAGLPVRCLAGGAAVRMRSYPGGTAQLIGGWTKNMASGAVAAPPRAALAAAAWVCAHHAVAMGAVLNLLGTSGPWGIGPHGSLRLWLVAWVVFAWQQRSILRRLGSFRWWTWALFPVPLLVFDVLFLTSVAMTGLRGSVRWRGREVDVRRRAATGRTG